MSTQFTPEYLAFDEGPEAIRAMSAILGITTVVIALRFGLRIFRKVRLGIEDWSMIFALLLAWALDALAVYGILYGGFGKHLSVVIYMDPTYHTLKTGEFVEWIGELVYVSLITTVKFSVLSMYLRLFPTRFVKYGTGILGTVATMWFISILLVVIFQCSPVAMAWDPLISTGHCVDKEQFFLGNSIPNILTDLAILCLPMYQVYQLNVNRGRKIGLVFVFLLGGLVVVVSIYRLKVLIDLVHQGLSADYTVEINRANIWTVVEPAIGMISASIPTLGSLITLFGRLFHSLSSKPTGNPENKRGDQNLVTIGGSGQSGLSRKFLRGKKSSAETTTTDGDGTFESLPDAESGSRDRSELLPSGYRAQQSTFVTSSASSSHDADTIPLKSIAVKQAMDWHESWKNQV